jgi:5'-methylthioadenosine phosphorylase
MATRVVGIIGGSGLYRIDGMEAASWTAVDTPWGAPSDLLLDGRIGGVRAVFLPRHGRGHALSPDGINYRANIDALKRLGVTDVISVSAVGALREDLAPGDFVLVDQFIDRTLGRERSFFGNGLVAHVAFGEPTCPRLHGHLAAAADALGIAARRGGSYLCIEGPQFSTRAESLLHRAWGADVVGMTNMPEARLAREAELCYATVAMVTDRDSWHPQHDQVEVSAILATMQDNAERARALVAALVPRLGGQFDCPAGCNRALDSAILTAPASRDPALVARLDAVAGRVLGERA